LDTTASYERAGAVLTVDLAAIATNYCALRARLGGAECAAVVKADAYGLGAAEVAPVLAAAGCRNFFVAHVEEGLALRAALGERAEILVLNGLPPGAEADCAAAGLVPVINSLEQLSAWRATARGEKLPAALQIDTGMSRLGLCEPDIARIADDPTLLAGIAPRLVMSHLACADEPAHPANERQRATFERLRGLLPPMRASLANSPGIFLGPAYHFDMARPGAALYGVNPTPGAPNPMRPVVTLSAKIIQLHDVPAGTGVGYGHDFLAERPTRLATIALGYADGWHRRSGAAAFWKGTRLQLAGRVSMDSMTLDVSALPAGSLVPGDLVDLICAEQPVDDVAMAAGTIGYEVLTSLGHRFHRRYVGATERT
jgi:alanine racemase